MKHDSLKRKRPENQTVSSTLLYPLIDSCIQSGNRDISVSLDVKDSLTNNQIDFHEFKHPHFSLFPFDSITLQKDIEKNDDEEMTDASCQSGQISSDENKIESSTLYGEDILYTVMICMYMCMCVCIYQQ